MKTCPKCHHPVEETQKFCANCAEPLASASAPNSGWKNPPAVSVPKQPGILSGEWQLPKTPAILAAAMAVLAAVGLAMFGSFMGNNRIYYDLIAHLKPQTMLLMIGLFVIALGLVMLLMAVRILQTSAAGLLKACSLGTGALFTVCGMYLLFLCIQYREIFSYARYGFEKTMAVVYYIPDFLFILTFGMLGAFLLSLILGGKQSSAGRILALLTLLSAAIAVITLLYKVMTLISNSHGSIVRGAFSVSYVGTLPVTLILFAATMFVFAFSGQKTEE